MRIVCLFVALLLAGCGSNTGAPCEIVGSGFTASHDCRHKCLSRTAIVCPNDARVLPKVCSGVAGCEPGGCGEGEVCYTVNDPFEDVSYCIPELVCEFKDAREKSAWELFSQQLATQSRLRQDMRQQRRKQTTNSPKTSPPE